MVETKYNPATVPGDITNHQQTARLDWTAGYLGISAQSKNGAYDRILLTPSQRRVLVAFIKQQTRRKKL